MMSGRDNLVVRLGANTAATDPSIDPFPSSVLKVKRCITHRTGFDPDFWRREVCGRFTQRTPAAILRREFELREVPTYEPRYNIAPTQNVLAVRQIGDEREAVWLKWGLIPPWAK